jgi:MFS family permease
MDNTQTIKWPQIYALTALNAAVVISWIAYHEYQPIVLKAYHLESLKMFLLVAKALVLVFIPPLAGIIADRIMRKSGNRFLIFMIGISITSLVFMSVSFSVSDHGLFDSANVLPIMIVLWLISMNIFHSPANSLLELFAPIHKLPLVMGVMALVMNLILALEPIVVELITWFGPVLTFTVGAILVGGTGFIFFRVTRGIDLKRDDHKQNDMAKSNFGLVLLPGLVLGLVLGFLKVLGPDFVKSYLEKPLGLTFHEGFIISGILAISAFSAFILARWVAFRGIKKSLFQALGGAIVMLTLFFLINNPYSMVFSGFGLGICLGICSVSAFPFAIQNMNLKIITLGTGIFFGSLELCEGILEIYMAS